MAELGQGLGIEGPGVVAGVVDQAASRAQRRIELAQPHQVDPGAGQAVGQRVGPLGLDERRGGEQADSQEANSSALDDAQKTSTLRLDRCDSQSPANFNSGHYPKS